MNKTLLSVVCGFLLLIAGALSGYFYTEKKAEKYILDLRSISLMNDTLLAIKIHELIVRGQIREATSYLEREISSLKTEADEMARHSSISLHQDSYSSQASALINKYESGVGLGY